MGALLAAAVACIHAVSAQVPREAGAAAQIQIAAKPSPEAIDVPDAAVLRVIEDRSLGNRWLLRRDPRHPGGPARLMLVSTGGRSADGRPGDVNPAAVQPAARRPQPILHPGEKVIVEEHSAIAEVRLAAVALENACAGSPLHVRLEIGGRVVSAIALGPGQARLLSQIREAR